MTTQMKKNDDLFSSISRLWKQKFKFVSPMPLEVCAENLAAKNERDKGLFANQHKLNVKVIPKGLGESTFKLHRDAARNLHVIVYGTLTKWDENSTLVEGQSQIGLFTLIAWFAVTIVSLIMFITVPATGEMPNYFSILFILVTVGMYGYMYAERNRMTKILYDTLSDQIY